MQRQLAYLQVSGSKAAIIWEGPGWQKENIQDYCAKGGNLVSRWLASVRNLEEACCLLAESPNIIDLKEPGQGTLGALSAEVVHQVVVLIKAKSRCQTSAAVGDLSREPAQIYRTVKEMAATGVDYVKIGLFPSNQLCDYFMVLRPLAAQGVSLVGVMFADKQPDFSHIPLMQQAGFKGVMLDTAVKDGLSLLHHLSLSQLGSFIESAHKAGLVSGLAGSLRIEDVPALLRLKPDYLGFRSALCGAQQRESSLDLKAIASLKQILESDSAPLETQPRIR